MRKFAHDRENAQPVAPAVTEPTAPLALVCSVPFECRELADALEDGAEIRIGRKPAWTGRLDGAPVLLVAGGMGKTNAAHALTALLETRVVSAVVGFGIGGAYPGSGLEPGEIALATSAVYGDEGVHAPGGWMSTEGIGIPLWQDGEMRRFNEFPLDADFVAVARSILVAAGITVRTGPFVTVSACSGTDALGLEMAARFGGVAEGMEGAALAHVAAIYGTPFLELRAVSNVVEDRDPARWRIRDAAREAQAAVRALAGSILPIAG